MTTHANIDDFDIGKAIFEKLKDLPVDRQQRVLRWVAEGLGSAAPLGSSPPQMPPPPAGPTPMAGGGCDIKSFVAAKAPKSDQQFAAVVAYYYRFEAPPAERRDSISGDSLQEAARLAGRKRLSGPRVTLNNAKAAGYLDAIARGEFAINSVGENLVAMTLPGSADASAQKVRKKKANRKKNRK